MKRLMIVGLVTSLAGCAGSMGMMTADQITAAAKDKASAVGCTSYTGTGGQFQAMFVNNDQTFHSGGGTTTVECGSGKVTFSDAGQAAKQPAPTPATVAAPFTPISPKTLAAPK